VRRILPALVATVVLLALVLAWSDLAPGEMGAAVLERLRTLHTGPVLLAFLVYLASYVGRAIRFAILMPGLHGLVHLTSVSARHNFLNLVLPFRTGELALPWILKRESGRSMAESSAALLVARVLDLSCVAAWLSLGLLWRGLDAEARRQALPQAVLLLGLLLLGLCALAPVARRLGPRIGHWGVGPQRMRDFAARALGHLGQLSVRRLAAAGVVSLLTWLATYATYAFMLRAMAGDDPVGRALGSIDFVSSLVGTTGLHLSTVLPVNTVGGLGSWEIGWVSGYELLAGLDRESATISAVVSHVLNFVFISIIGGLGFLLRKPPLRDPASADDGAAAATTGATPSTDALRVPGDSPR